MALSSSDRQALASIEAELAASDQKLSSMLATYSRLTAGEAMPGQERIRTGWLAAIRPPRRARGPRGQQQPK